MSPPRQPHRQWQVLCSLLFGRFNWIQHHPGGGMTVPTAQFAAQLGLRPTRLRAYLDLLEATGLVSHVRWWRGAFYCRVQPPPGWARVVQTVPDSQNASVEAGMGPTIDVPREDTRV